jgi:hypothetical protein
MQNLKAISADQLVLISSIFAVLLSDDLDPDALNVLGNLIVAIGSLMLTIAAQAASQQKQASDDTSSPPPYLQAMKDQLDALQRQLKAISG